MLNKFKKKDEGRTVWVWDPLTREEVEGVIETVGTHARAGQCMVRIHEEQEVNIELSLWFNNGDIRKRPNTIRGAK